MQKSEAIDWLNQHLAVAIRTKLEELRDSEILLSLELGEIERASVHNAAKAAVQTLVAR